MMKHILFLLLAFPILACNPDPATVKPAAKKIRQQTIDTIAILAGNRHGSGGDADKQSWFDELGNVYDKTIKTQLKNGDKAVDVSVGDLNGDGVNDVLLLVTNEQVLSLLIFIGKDSAYSLKGRNDELIGDYTDCPLKIEEMKIQFPEFSVSYSNVNPENSFSLTYNFIYDPSGKNWFLNSYVQKTVQYQWSNQTQSYNPQAKEKELRLSTKDFGRVSFKDTHSLLRWE